MSEQQRPKNIHESIEAMTALLAKTGISKDQGKTAEVKYAFRGIDDIRNVIAPLQRECALNIIPKVISREEKERTTKSGGFALWVVLNMQFDFINTVDGSLVTAPWVAEAVDYSDKATQKAISQGFKTVCINVFNIPTEGEDDTDDEKKEFMGKKIGAFESEELRKVWVANCKDAFERAENLATLKDIEGLNHSKLIIMAASDDAIDRNHADDIRKLYKQRYDEFSAVTKGKTL